MFYLCSITLKQRDMKTENNNEKTQTQNNTYEVVYSDGVRVLDYIIASNLREAKRIAAENARMKNYGTAYYKIRRCYNGGVNALTTNWH